MHGFQGSQAYAKALAKAGVLTAEEAECIVEGLGKVRSAVLLSCMPCCRLHGLACLQTTCWEPLHPMASNHHFLKHTALGAISLNGSMKVCRYTFWQGVHWLLGHIYRETLL